MATTRLRVRLIVLAAVGVAACASGAVLAQAPAGQTTAAQEAGKLYTSAMSQYSAGQYKQAQPLLEKFVSAYPTHEYVTVAYLQLAACRSNQKDIDGYQKALDEVIGRFYGSPAWLIAYGSKLGYAKSQKDNDGYLTLLEAMLRQAEEAPFRLHGAIGWYWGDYYNNELNNWQALDPTAVKLGGVVSQPGWVLDLLDVADTPERGERVLKLLATTFSQRAKDLPPDWQHAHVALLRQAGKAAEAAKALAGYLDAWAQDPQGIALRLLEIKAAGARKDAAGVDADYEELFKTYPGAASLEEPMYQRLGALANQDKYDEFCALAKTFLKNYDTSIWYDYVLSWWTGMAQRLAEKGDSSRLASTLAMLDEFTGKHPGRQSATLNRKISLHIATKNYAEAAKLAATLIDEQHWCAASFDAVSQYAATDAAYAKLVDAAREKWKIPLPNPASRAFALLNQLKLRLREDQVRHAEEVGEEMFVKHRDDASTIDGVKALADYYFAKVLPDGRDKWMARMVQSYPTHPLTQAVLANQIVTEQAAQRNDALASAIDTMHKNFPGTFAGGAYFRLRCDCYDVAKDFGGKLTIAKAFWGGRADAGEVEALQELARFEEAPLGEDNKAAGDLWAEKARKFAGKRAEIYCLSRAWSWYYASPYYYSRHLKVHWALAEAMTAALKQQPLDSELRWKLEFADVNLAAQQEAGATALKAMNERLKDGAGFRDLSLRVDFSALGSSLGKSGLASEGLALAKKLAKACPSTRDQQSIQIMLGSMHAAGKDLAAAAADYLKIVDDSRCPARMYWIFNTAQSWLRQANSPRYAGEMERYMKKIARVQELVPGLMFTLGEYYIQTRDAAVLQTHKALTSRYPASSARDRLDELFAKLPK